MLCRCKLCVVSIKHSWLMTINASLEGMNNINLQMNTADQQGPKTILELRGCYSGLAFITRLYFYGVLSDKQKKHSNFIGEFIDS